MGMIWYQLRMDLDVVEMGLELSKIDWNWYENDMVLIRKGFVWYCFNKTTP